MLQKNQRMNNYYLGFSPLFLLLGITFSGCHSQRENFLWILGSQLFIIYSISLIGILLLHRIHKWSTFISLMDKARNPASVLGAGVAIVGGWTILCGIPRLFDEPGPEKLKPFLGAMILIAGVKLYKWARASSASEKAGHAKIVSMTVGFVVGLIYVMSGLDGVGPS